MLFLLFRHFLYTLPLRPKKKACSQCGGACFPCRSFQGQHHSGATSIAALRGKTALQEGGSKMALSEGAGRPLRGVFCDQFSIPDPRRDPAQRAENLSEPLGPVVPTRYSFYFFTIDMRCPLPNNSPAFGHQGLNGTIFTVPRGIVDILAALNGKL